MRFTDWAALCRRKLKAESIWAYSHQGRWPWCLRVDCMVIRSTACFAETPIAVNPLHSSSPKLELHLRSVENNVEQIDPDRL